MLSVLEYNQTTGTPFQVRRSGWWIIALSGLPSDATANLQWQGKGNAFFNVDSPGSVDGTWTGSGMVRVMLVSGFRYRMHSSARGAGAQLKSTTGGDLAGPEAFLDP